MEQVIVVKKGVFDRGTAQSARALGFQGIAAGKTGTTSNYKDAWFVGFTPQLLGLSWVGFDDNTPHQMSGSRAALPIWVRFMKKVVGDSTQDFTFPKEIAENPASIDAETWPTGHQIASTLSQWHSAKLALHQTYQAIPKDQRAGIQPPEE